MTLHLHPVSFKNQGETEKIRHFTFGHRGLHIIMSFTQLLFCLILGLVGIVVAYQADESGYYSYWKPETYADYEPQEKQSFATKTNPLANIFNRIQSRQSVGGIGAVSENK